VGANVPHHSKIESAAIYPYKSSSKSSENVNFVWQQLGNCFAYKMLYFIGLGLADERDITVRGLDIVRSAARVYLEAYTSVLLVDKTKLVSWRSRTTTLSSYMLIRGLPA